MPSNDYLMLRSAQKARLEARTASLQLVFRFVGQFPDSLFFAGTTSQGYRELPGRVTSVVSSQRAR